MSSLFKNLITRQQNDGADVGPNLIINPRPKLRFEQSAIAESTPQEIEPVSSPATTSIESSDNEAPPSVSASNTHQTVTKKIMETAAKIDQSSASIAAVEEHHAQLQPVTNKSTQAITNEFFFNETKLDQSTTELNNPSIAPQPQTQRIIEQRLATIINNNLGQLSAESDTKDAQQIQTQTESFETINNIFNTSEKNPPENIRQDPGNSPLKNHDQSQKGLLQVPSWLAEIKTELSTRMQTPDAPATAEPVINVTIGRIEVKAIKTDTEQAAKTVNKPSGIMGLDDYLKQRNKGRS